MKVWEKSHQLALVVYAISAQFPRTEQYGLTSQIRRSAVSIPSNIAEACGRGSAREIGHFLQISMGSASELQYELLLAQDLGILKSSDWEKLDENVTEIKRMLASLIRKLKTDS